ncbi:hypothetical protein [Paenibacillus woosongensis]|uniref:Uncharacterized protein n=1 Tax=Paenibacillus woosongensis TaxID=307580 RepID=A0A7X2YYS5_9BACL|nr:hypothetical protein [Paenibacillus woosongensis]MUG44315.1 hypothetical protein [Paenibacillus woosongensis]
MTANGAPIPNVNFFEKWMPDKVPQRTEVQINYDKVMKELEEEAAKKAAKGADPTGIGSNVSRLQLIEDSKNFAREELEKHVKFLKDGGIKKPLDDNGFGGGKYKPDVISAGVDITTVGGKNPKISFGYNGAREGQFNPSVMELHPDLKKVCARNKKES